MTKPASLSPELIQAFEAVPDLYLIISPELYIITASKPYLMASLRDLEKIRGKYLFEVFPDNPTLLDSDATTNLRSSLEWVLEHKQPHQMALQRYDVPQPGNPGLFREKYWLPLNTPVLDEEGNVRYIIHKVEDATESIMSQKRLEQSKQQLKQLLQEQASHETDILEANAGAELERRKLHNLLMQAPAMICILEGPEHVITFVNPPYQKLVADRQLIGKPIAEAMPELEGQSVLDLLNHVYQAGENVLAHEMLVQLDHDNTGKLGHNYYNFIYQATHNLEGKIEGILVFAYEVTAQVVARQEVVERERALQELNNKLTLANSEARAANEELQQMQQVLQELNQQLEEKIAERTEQLELSKAETEAQRNRLHKLFMEAPAPVCIIAGEDFVYELVNPAYQQLLPGRELLGNSLLNEALTELAHQPIADILRHVYRTGETINSTEALIPVAPSKGAALEERYFNYTLQARRDENGKTDGIIIFAYEVTEQVEARKASEANVNKLRLITDALPVLIAYLDKKERYQFANKFYEYWFPYKSEELLGKHVCEVIGEEAYQGVKSYIDRALAGERIDFESRMPYREDFVKYIRTSCIPDIRKGKVAGFYTLIHDITDQVEAQQKIEEREKEAKALAQKLEEANRELKIINEQLRRTNIDLDNFIYTASHDLKAPIANIEGLMLLLFSALPQKTLANAGLKDIASMVEDSIGRFKRTINHLTEVTKLQKENNQEAVEVDLSKVVRDVRLDFASQLKEAGVKLYVNVDGCPGIHFSEKNLRSIVYNLLSNAIKYRSPERVPEISITCQQDGEFIVLTVQDNGLGMNLKGRQKLFSMFGRLHDHVEGSGIGLYMVKKIVENADGRIEVESEVGKGSVFRVYLKT